MSAARRPLIGMRDLSEEECRRLLRVQDGLQSSLALCGYRTVDTPVLEPTDIFLRKSGGALASQMYSFVEPGGRQVSLRPEFTSQVIRLYLQDEGAQPLPVRWQYAGPVFRYAPGAVTNRQFTQVGAELIGAGGPAADAEVMTTAVGALTSLGLRPLRLVAGDVGAVHGLLRQFRLSERATHFLLNAIGGLRDGGDGALAGVRERGVELGLLALSERPAGMDDVAQRLAAADAGSAAPLGVRTAEEILQRLGRKLQATDRAEDFDRALAFTGALSRVAGVADAALAEARALATSYGLDAAPLTALEASLAAWALHDVRGVDVAVDMGLAGDIAYYTGLVFEVWGGDVGDGEGGRARLAGGGRYDGLVRALGGDDDVPALGFACSLEVAAQALGDAGGLGADARERKRALVAPRTPDAVGAALRAAASLRLAGEVAAVALDGPVDAQDARLQGFSAIIAVDKDGASERTWL